MTNEKEVPELAEKCGLAKGHAVFISPLNGDTERTDIYTGRKAELLAFAAAIEEKHQAQIAMLVDFIKRAQVSSGVCCCGDSMENHAEPYVCGHVAVDIWDNAVLGIVKDAQQDTDAFIAEIEAGALEKSVMKLEMEIMNLTVYEARDVLRVMAAEKRKQAAELRASAAQPEGEGK